MSRVDPSKFHYFSPVEGRVVSRYGSTGYVGARYEQGIGFVVDTNVVVKISDAMYRGHLKAWRRALRDGSLVEKTAEDYQAYLKKLEARSAEEARVASAPQTEDDGSQPDATRSGSKRNKKEVS
jgi:hypothetical protein